MFCILIWVQSYQHFNNNVIIVNVNVVNKHAFICHKLIIWMIYMQLIIKYKPFEVQRNFTFTKYNCLLIKTDTLLLI
jgi:hypothetical protein